MRVNQLIAALAAISSGCVMSCGPGAVGEAARPKDPTANTALEEGECRAVDKGGEPLIVDWKPEQRGNLEVAMKDGVAVVAYSCESIKLLEDCHLSGEYGFIGMTRKEQVVRLENADEVRANLPLSGAALSAELDRGSTIDVAMIIVGKKRTTWDTPFKKDLKGKCEGATHYVRGAIVGAFAVDTGARAKVRAAAEVFGAGASTQSSSNKQIKTKEGDLSACAKSAPDAEDPPAECGAPIRLVLSPIAPDAPEAPAKPGEEKPKALAASEEHDCPKGMVYTNGKCTTTSAATAYQCKSGDQAECSAQCDKGHPGSCGSLGVILANSREYEKAATAMQKACEGDDTRSCVNLGFLKAQGLGMKADLAAAVKLFEKGCNSGEAIGCRELGRSYQLGSGGLGQDDARAAKLYGHACDGGDMTGCAFIGASYLEGKGVAEDPRQAATFYRRACDGGHGESCAIVGELYETGRGGGKNPQLAGQFYQRGCFRGAAPACVNYARVELDSRPNEAKRHFESACNFKRDTVACAVTKLVFGGKIPVFAKPNEMSQWLRSCNSGSARDCATYGTVQAATATPAMGKPYLQRACTSGDKFACAVMKKL